MAGPSFGEIADSRKRLRPVDVSPGEFRVLAISLIELVVRR